MVTVAAKAWFANLMNGFIVLMLLTTLLSNAYLERTIYDPDRLRSGAEYSNLDESVKKSLSKYIVGYFDECYIRSEEYAISDEYVGCWKNVSEASQKFLGFLDCTYWTFPSLVLHIGAMCLVAFTCVLGIVGAWNPDSSMARMKAFLFIASVFQLIQIVILTISIALWGVNGQNSLPAIDNVTWRFGENWRFQYGFWLNVVLDFFCVMNSVLLLWDALRLQQEEEESTGETATTSTTSDVPPASAKQNGKQSKV